VEENGDGIAQWYAELFRGGSAMHRLSRDTLRKVLPVNVIGLDVLDVGCGEGIDPTHAPVARAEAAEREPDRSGLPH
jgi:2-polyprenyl-3-methyl-5-hydroxy-6-metoxy-1,4-benzoquinol methylase